MDLDTFLQAYVACALWSSMDNSDESGGRPLDENNDASDIAPESLAMMTEGCKAFIAANAADLDAYAERMRSEQWTGAERAGHDFWLTRNGHGAGFWDRGLGDLGTRLSDAAKAHGEADLYVGDDGKLYVTTA